MSSIIIIEGNIGVGKTTLTDFIASHMNYRPMREPVEENPYLKQFYVSDSNRRRYALEMQFWLMSRRFHMHQEAIRHVLSTGQGVVMDRSIYGDYVFARRLHLDGHIDARGFDNYMAMRGVMERQLYVPRIAIMLMSRPEVCMERIRERSRGCEVTITEEYIAGLSLLYCELHARLKMLGCKRVVEWDWNNFPTAAHLQALVEEAVAPSFSPDYPGLDAGEAAYPSTASQARLL